MSTLPPCPHCGERQLGYDPAWGRRFTAMAGELLQPWKILWNTLSPLARQAAQRMEVVRSEYRCNSCHRRAFICPNCNGASRLDKGPNQAEVLTCSDCGRESVYRLD